MASTKEYLDFILEQLSDLDEVSFRAMMGEYIPGAIFLTSLLIGAENLLRADCPKTNHLN